MSPNRGGIAYKETGCPLWVVLPRPKDGLTKFVNHDSTRHSMVSAPLSIIEWLLKSNSHVFHDEDWASDASGKVFPRQ